MSQDYVSLFRRVLTVPHPGAKLRAISSLNVMKNLSALTSYRLFLAGNCSGALVADCLVSEPHPQTFFPLTWGISLIGLASRFQLFRSFSQREKKWITVSPQGPITANLHLLTKLFIVCWAMKKVSKKRQEPTWHIWSRTSRHHQVHNTKF